MRRYSALLFMIVLVSAGSIRAQQSTGEIEAAEFIIEKEKTLSLPVIQPVLEPYRFEAVRPDPTRVRFRILEPDLEIAPFRPDFSVQLLEKPSLPFFYNNFIRAGYGNFNSPLIEFRHQSHRQKGPGVGARFFHESFAKGPVRNKRSAQSTTDLLVGINFDGKIIKLTPVVSYQHNSYFFYGLSDQAFANDSTDIFRGRILENRLNAAFLLESKAMRGMKFSLKPAWNFGNQKAAGLVFNEENNFYLDGEIIALGEKQIKPAATVHFGLSDYAGIGDVVRQWYSVHPYLQVDLDKLKLRAGFNGGVFQDSTDQSQFFVLPDISLKYALGSTWSVSGGLSGGLQQNRLVDLLIQNPFMQDSLDLRTTVIPFSVEGELQGMIISGLVVKAGVRMSSVEDQFYFANSSADSSRFGLLYEEDNVTRLDLYARADYKLSSILGVYTDFRFVSIGSKITEEPIHIPSSEYNLGMDITLFEKIQINPSLKVLAGIHGLEGGAPTSLSTIYDLRARLGYRFNDQARIFIQLDNLLNRQNERYLYYPVRSFSVKAGFSYQF